jgi:hypothetical protein
MKLSEFIMLGRDEKKMTLLHHGILVAKRSNTGSIVFLFQLEFFYAEMYCSLEKKEVEEYRVFSDTNSLMPYLDKIPIEALFRN